MNSTKCRKEKYEFCSLTPSIIKSLSSWPLRSVYWTVMIDDYVMLYYVIFLGMSANVHGDRSLPEVSFHWNVLNTHMSCFKNSRWLDCFILTYREALISKIPHLSKVINRKAVDIFGVTIDGNWIRSHFIFNY